MAKRADIIGENDDVAKKHTFSPVSDFVLESRLFWRVKETQRRKLPESISGNKIEVKRDVLRNEE
jgi:hypothetical protein